MSQIAPERDLVETDDQERDRFTHIVVEGFWAEDRFVPSGNDVVGAELYGTPVKALCGKVWVPGRDPKRYPLCLTCAEIAKRHGWRVPS